MYPRNSKFVKLAIVAENDGPHKIAATEAPCVREEEADKGKIFDPYYLYIEAGSHLSFVPDAISWLISHPASESRLIMSVAGDLKPDTVAAR